MDIGLIGLGEVGIPIGRHLLNAGHSLVVHDLRRETGTKLEKLGAQWAASPREVGIGEVESVLTTLPSPAAVTAVVEGADGLLAGLHAGQTWIDISTNDRRELMRLAALCKANGVHVLETPVTGGIPLLHRGEMTILVGGEKDVFERQRPILELFGGDIIHLGPVGSASIAKVVTNMMAAIHLWALGEGLMLGKCAGLEVGPLFEAVLASCAKSFVAETEGREILNGSYDYGFTLELASKDAHLAYKLGREFSVPLEMGSLIEQLFHRAMAKYGPDTWSTQVVKLLEDDLGTDLCASGYETPPIER